MRYFMLRKLRDDLIKKSNKTREEQQLLEELISLGSILNIETSSLGLSSNVCRACGRAL